MRDRGEHTAWMKKFVRPLVIGGCIGALGCTALLLIMAAVMAGTDVPQSAVTPMAIVAAACGAFLGGMVAAGSAKEKGWLLGALCGLLLFLLVAVTGLVWLHSVRGTYLLVKALILVGCGTVGGMIGVNMRKR